MLGHAWLLSDLDGTLISTPHKAGGQYLPLDKSPCFNAVKRWICNGGNLCIVTTADRRVIAQVYIPLRPFLRRGTDGESRNPERGELLLSIYAGAVLFRCTADGVEYSRGYKESIHCVTGESIELAKMYGFHLDERLAKGITVSKKSSTEFEACVKGTCFSLNLSSILVEKLEGIFFLFLTELLEQEPTVIQAFAGMSTRYKYFWAALFEFLQAQYEARGADSNAVQWKVDFLRRRHGVCVAIGIIRVALAETSEDTSGSDTTVEVNKISDANGSKGSKEEGGAVASIVHALGNSDKSTRLFARALVNLLGTDAESAKTAALLSKRDENSCGAVAQVIILGVPMRLFSRYFSSHLPFFTSLGVSSAPQPNSVIFSKMGVCKSTAIRYLLGEGTAPAADRRSLRGIVCSDTCAALGDNPQSTDFGLTVFPKIPFVSLERKEQRRSRHARIDAMRPSMTERQRRGTMMDDRRVAHLHYVGGEENGTAVFLTRLMDLLDVPSLKESRCGGVPHVVPPKAIMSAIRCAAAEAHQKVSGPFACL